MTFTRYQVRSVTYWRYEGPRSIHALRAIPEVRESRTCWLETSLMNLDLEVS